MKKNYTYQEEETSGQFEERKTLERIKKNIYHWYGYFSNNYYQGRIDKYFLLVDQWDSVDREDLIRLGVPILTFNKLYDVIKKIKGQMREWRPDPKIRSRDSIAETPEELEELSKKESIVEGIIRSIAYNSRINTQYEIAADNALESGHGVLCVDTDYEHDMSFHQEPKVYGLAIPERAFFDPHAETITKTDGNFCGKYTTVTREMFEKMYPDVEVSLSFPSEYYYNYFTWGDESSVTWVDYYEKDWYKEKIYLLSDGQSVTEDEFNEIKKTYTEQNLPIPSILDDKEIERYKIIYYRAIENKILIGPQECPSDILPYVFVDGDSYIIDGEQRTQTFIRHAIDCQKFLNYVGVAIAQAIKNARREPFLATPDNIKGFEEIWKNPERYQGVLLANADRKSGSLPQRISPSEVPQTFLGHYQRASDDLQSILGFYNANLGAPTQEISGVALDAKVRQGNTAVYVYQSNLLTAIEEVGRIIVSMIPKLYDAERIVTTMSQDGRSKNIKINTFDQNGNPQNHILDSTYDIEVEIGPSFELQKADAMQTLMQFANLLAPTDPDVVKALLPKIAENLDLDNKNQIVDILNHFVPPNIKAMEQGMPPPPLEPPPPDPMIAIKQQELQLRQQANQIKQQDQVLKAQAQQANNMQTAQGQRLDALKIMTDNHQKLTETEQKKLQSIAEMHKADLDYESNKQQILASLLKDRANKS